MKTPVVLALWACTWLAAAPAHTQREPAPPRDGAVVHGVVMDQATGQPLEGVLLCLTPLPPPAADPTAANCPLGSLTDAEGRYRFPGLTLRSYRLRALHLGYESRELLVDLHDGARLPLWITLATEPVRLPPLALTAERSQWFDRDGAAARGSAADGGAAGVALEPVPADAHRLDFDAVLRSASLGEPDLLRSLRRLPGVVTRSDYTAELWTRGAPWYQTRVFFDGVPLFQPLHGLGAFTAVPASAVGAVTFLPGAQSASGGDGAAGVIDIRSRRASGSGTVNGRGDLSLVGAGLSLDQRVARGAAGWSVTARRTHIHWLTSLAQHWSSRPLHVPLEFADAVVSLDARVHPAHAFEFSLLHQNDQLSPDARADTGPAAARWGSTAARASWMHTAGRLQVRHTAGGSTHAMHVPAPLLLPPALLPAAHGDRMQSDIAYLMLRGDVMPLAAAHAGGWAAGYEAGMYRMFYHGAASYSIPRPASSVAAAANAVPSTRQQTEPAGAVSLRDRLLTLAGWLEHARYGEQWRIRSGVRLESGDAVAGAGSFRAAPRLSLHYLPRPDIAVFASAGRTYQYAQAVAPAGVHVASMSAGYLWLVGSADVPVLRADAATVGLQADAEPLRGRISAWGRRSTGMTIADPSPGPLFDRVGWLVAQNHARGLEASLEARHRAVDASAAWTLASSTLLASGVRFPAASDVRHALDLATALQVTTALRVGASYSFASGVPFTRVFGAWSECAVEDCEPQSVPWAGPPNDARAPHYSSLDLMLEWSSRLRRADTRLYVQLRNALGRDNETVYTGGSGCGTACATGAELQDRIERGLPRLPLLGVHVRF